ncbi:hypothetical protein CR513_16869, partial [Mucuna pruriens]
MEMLKVREMIEKVIIPMGIWEFLALMEKGKVVEHLECSTKVGKTSRIGSFKFKKGQHPKKHYNKPYDQ